MPTSILRIYDISTCKIDDQKLSVRCVKQGTQNQVLRTTQRMGWEEVGRGFRMGDTGAIMAGFISMYGKNDHNSVK